MLLTEVSIFQPSDAKPVITANAINETNIAYEAFLNRGAKDHGRSSRDET